MVYLGADHRGFKLKQKLKAFLQEAKIDFQDLGAMAFVEEDDYPIYAEHVAKAVASKGGLGILICGSGHGVTIAANKVRGARAVLAENEKSVKEARNDDNANILCLHGDKLDSWKMNKLVLTFINTPFEEEERFLRRLREIERIEERNL